MRVINESILNNLRESEFTIPEEFKEVVNKIEDLGWDISMVEYANGDFLNFAKYSDAGEDFSFEVEAKGLSEVAKDVRQYAEDFDPIDHAREMDGAPGAPDLRVLLKDADKIKAYLEELATMLEAEVPGPIQESLHYTPEDLDEIRKIQDDVQKEMEREREAKRNLEKYKEKIGLRI